MKSITAISAGTLMLLCGNLMAQDTQEVKVEATRIVSKESPIRKPYSFPMNDLSLTYGVSLAGVNLATSSGATEAERRVREAAKAACEAIGQRYPNATPSDKECAKAATDEGMTKVHQLIAAAEKATSK